MITTLMDLAGMTRGWNDKYAHVSEIVIACQTGGFRQVVSSLKQDQDRADQGTLHFRTCSYDHNHFIVSRHKSSSEFQNALPPQSTLSPANHLQIHRPPSLSSPSPICASLLLSRPQDLLPQTRYFACLLHSFHQSPASVCTYTTSCRS